MISSLFWMRVQITDIASLAKKVWLLLYFCQFLICCCQLRNCRYRRQKNQKTPILMNKSTLNMSYEICCAKIIFLSQDIMGSDRKCNKKTERWGCRNEKYLCHISDKCVCQDEGYNNTSVTSVEVYKTASARNI